MLHMGPCANIYNFVAHGARATNRGHHPLFAIGEQVHLVLNERAVDQRRNQPMATGRGMQLTRQIGEHLVAAELKDWAI